ncbi:Rpn family recombination-promoting nuclease/putative transposase [Dyadobacter sp. CY312]|uniref:Rpn family recombination-promoting nuclease/putative transposase n=1 Tax=Dyadobacter sp. CY312 TaxID=2907303 RepID=UPI001F48A40E|nr:Rpn family recombination-promoting nuclease/putative transposase [Dyadobacter sp. CY312]MCE7040758.1 Rpn family recombination-promoting nuclease/putative transposase [Dyadobacter sp. CY312]
MSKLSIHDNFIRSIMSDKNVARDYFKGFLPGLVRDLLDLDSLEQSTDTYVSKELHKTMSDIVYTCRKKDMGEPVKICLLIEHKSYVDQNTPVQIGGYIFAGLMKQVVNKESISMIIPILLYHGKKRWEYQTLSDLFVNLEPALRSFVPNFDYIYNDLGEISDEQIELLENKFLVASMLALKYSFNKKWLELNAVRLLVWSDGIDGNLQSGFIVYLFERSELKENNIVDILEAVPFKIKDKVMSTLDIFVEKGRKIGLEEGIGKGIEKGLEKGIAQGKSEFVSNLLKNTDFDHTKIAALANVSQEFVRNVQLNLNK